MISHLTLHQQLHRASINHCVREPLLCLHSHFGCSRLTSEPRVPCACACECDMSLSPEWSDEEMFYSSYYFKAILYRGTTAPPAFQFSLHGLARRAVRRVEHFSWLLRERRAEGERNSTLNSYLLSIAHTGMITLITANRSYIPYRSAEPQCSCSSMLGGLPSLPWLEAPCRAEAWRSAWRSTRSM